MNVEERLEDLGLELLPLSGEKSKVAPAIRSGDLVFTSLFYSDEQGKLGNEITAAQGYQIVQAVTIQCLSALKSLLGDLDHITQVIKIQIYLNSDPTFTDQVQVYHGATELLLDIFGEETGRSVRSAVGVAVLHDNAAVAMEMVVQA